MFRRQVEIEHSQKAAPTLWEKALDQFERIFRRDSGLGRRRRNNGRAQIVDEDGWRGAGHPQAMKGAYDNESA